MPGNDGDLLARLNALKPSSVTLELAVPTIDVQTSQPQTIEDKLAERLKTLRSGGTPKPIGMPKKVQPAISSPARTAESTRNDTAAEHDPIRNWQQQVNAYHEATDGVENAWDSAKHWFTGESNTNATALGLIDQGHQSCKAIDNWFFISYTIIIGVDYYSSRCATVKEKLTEEEHVNAWKSVNDPTKGSGKEGRGYLKLQFSAGRNKEPALNKDLTSEFADINGFNCPG